MPKDRLQSQIAITIGRRVRQYRKDAGLTEEKLAAKAGTTGQTIHRIETGKSRATVATLRGVATALDVDLEMLIFPLPTSLDP